MQVLPHQLSLLGSRRTSAEDFLSLLQVWATAAAVGFLFCSVIFVFLCVTVSACVMLCSVPPAYGVFLVLLPIRPHGWSWSSFGCEVHARWVVRVLIVATGTGLELRWRELSPLLCMCVCRAVAEAFTPAGE